MVVVILNVKRAKARERERESVRGRKAEASTICCDEEKKKSFNLEAKIVKMFLDFT